MARILIVEDESVVAWDLQESLEKLGYTVLATVTSGSEAVQIPTTIKPDLVLMDIMLEGEIDGIAAATAIRDRFNIPVVFLTAHADDQTLQRALNISPHGYIVKPFVERELYTTVEIALRRHQLEMRQEQTKQWLITTIRSIEEATIATDRQGCITFMNPVAESLTGWQYQEVLGKPASEMLPLLNPENRKKIDSPWGQAMQNGIKVNLLGSCLLLAKNGKEILIKPSVTPIRNKQGQIIGSAIVFQNITTHKQLESAQYLVETISQQIQQLRHLDEIMESTVTEVRQLFQNNRIIIYRFNSDGSGSVVVESVATGLKPMLGLEEYEPRIVNLNALDRYKLGQTQIIADIYTTAPKSEQLQFWQFFNIRTQLAVPLLNGEKLWGLFICYNSAVSWQWQSWQIEVLKHLSIQLNIAIQQTEITDELKRTNQKLKDITAIDSLTELMNQRRFDECLAQEWKLLAESRIPLSLILCNIDCFAAFNYTYGYEAGDHCLRQVAGAICDSVVRSTDLVARYSGGEFIIMLPHTNAEAAVWIAQKIRSTVKRLKITHESSTVNRYVTLSFGVASMIPNLKSSPRILVALADQSLYQAKSEGGDCLRHQR